MPAASEDGQAHTRPLFREAVVRHSKDGEVLRVPRRFGPRSVARALVGVVGDTTQEMTHLLRRRRSPRVPFVPQVELTDCGAACLGMVLGSYGIASDQQSLRSALGAKRDGVSARRILAVARENGLPGRGVRMEPADFAFIPCPAILHWGMTHFVVLESARRDSITVVDPMSGVRRMSYAEVDRSFTGVALVFEEPPEVNAAAAKPIKTPWRMLTGLLRPRRGWAAVIALSFTLQLIGLLVPFAIKVTTDGIVPDHDRASAEFLVFAVVPFAIALMIVDVGRAMLLTALQAQADYSLVTRLTDHLLHLPFPFFQTRSAGDLLMRVRSTSVVREIVSTSAVTAILDGSLATLALVTAALVDWRSALVAAVVATLQVGVLLVTWRPLTSIARDGLDAQARSHGLLMELLSGVETVKLTGTEDEASRRWANRVSEELNLEIRRGQMHGVSRAAVVALRTAAPFAVLSYGAHRVLDDTMSLGTLFALMALTTMFLTSSAEVASTALRFSLLDSYLQRMADVFTTPRDKEGLPPLEIQGDQFEVVVDRVSHAFSTGGQQVLEDISLVIASGTSLGVAGPSGSGKSTLAMLVAGLFGPMSGRVLYNNCDLARFDARATRAEVGVVSQQAYVFAGSIRENITLGDLSFTDSEIEEAARAACLHDEIVVMPMGYDTVVADGGSTISGGQRQRLAIARALLRQPKLLVLDEATSALDGPTEGRILRHVRAVGTTCVIVAHRLTTIEHCDVIAVLDGGRLAEVGEYHDLSRRGGLFSNLLAGSCDNEDS